MGQPELEFEFDPPDFLHDRATSAQPPKKLNLLKYVTAACVLLAGGIGIVSLFYADVTNDVVMQALGRKMPSRVKEPGNSAAVDPKILMAKLEERTTSLSERVAALETSLYRAKATALGFRNPSIQSVSLAAQPAQPFIYPVRGENRLELKIVQITSEAIVVEVTGIIPEGPVKTVRVAQPLKVGSAAELTQGIGLEGMPHVFMTVLEMPSKDTAIIAVGAKEVGQS